MFVAASSNLKGRVRPCKNMLPSSSEESQRSEGSRPESRVLLQREPVRYPVILHSGMSYRNSIQFYSIACTTWHGRKKPLAGGGIGLGFGTMEARRACTEGELRKRVGNQTNTHFLSFI